MRSALLAAGRHPLCKVVEQALSTRCSVGRGCGILVGVSGGADSTALLLLLAALRERGAIGEVLPAYVHHHLREAADGESAHVGRLAQSLGFNLVNLDVFPDRAAPSVPAQARTLRYQALCQAAREALVAHVAVAHHADDQLETMLMALCRGSAVRGLSGMRPSRPLDAGVALVRPLLAATKAELIDVCKRCEVGWLEDATNEAGASLRGSLRHEVTAALDRLWPGAAARASRTADAAAAADVALTELLKRSMGDTATRLWTRAHLRETDATVIALGFGRCISDGFDYQSTAAAAAGIRDQETTMRRWSAGAGWRIEADAHSVRLLEPVAESQGVGAPRQAS
ncbi:MAG: tRNA lysidine(34) synthetase TilS [Phycisphaerales bacterium]|nr:tRNA lysidine(34) synthetase TilS [Phycisphaerales bacterium]